MSTFEEFWLKLPIPAEYDSMDQCDQQRWRGTIKMAFQAGGNMHCKSCKWWDKKNWTCEDVTWMDEDDCLEEDNFGLLPDEQGIHPNLTTGPLFGCVKFAQRDVV